MGSPLSTYAANQNDNDVAHYDSFDEKDVNKFPSKWTPPLLSRSMTKDHHKSSKRYQRRVYTQFRRLGGTIVTSEATAGLSDVTSGLPIGTVGTQIGMHPDKVKRSNID